MLFREFSFEVTTKYHSIDPKVSCPQITLQVTEDCCLNCSYCYQIHKTHKMMSIETARHIIDSLFKLYDQNNEDFPINHHTYGIILEFIGGEPFMNIEVIEDSTHYFIEQCIKRNHIWLHNFRISIASNGILYFTPKVQHYLKKYKDFVSLTISVDGPKELHDACRLDFDGNGSFDRAIAAMRHHRDTYTNGILTNIKITIAPENLPYLNTIFKFFLDEHAIILNANPIFEHEWTVDEARLFYYQLHKLADTLLLQQEHIETFLFSETEYRPLPESINMNYCGGTGSMLAYDPDGKAYPCLRYMPSSLGNDQPPLVIGDYTSIYSTPQAQSIFNEFNTITRRSQSDDECWDCPIARGCGWCSAYNYQKYGTCNRRCKNTCWMHRARSLANVYYWNHYYRNHASDKRFPLYLPKQIACQLITIEEYDTLLQLTELGG